MGRRFRVVPKNVTQAGGLGDDTALTRNADDVKYFNVVGGAVTMAQRKGAGRTAQEGVAVPLESPAVHR